MSCRHPAAPVPLLLLSLRTHRLQPTNERKSVNPNTNAATLNLESVPVEDTGKKRDATTSPERKLDRQVLWRWKRQTAPRSQRKPPLRLPVQDLQQSGLRFHQLLGHRMINGLILKHHNKLHASLLLIPVPINEADRLRAVMHWYVINYDKTRKTSQTGSWAHTCHVTTRKGAERAPHPSQDKAIILHRLVRLHLPNSPTVPLETHTNGQREKTSFSLSFSSEGLLHLPLTTRRHNLGARHS